MDLLKRLATATANSLALEGTIYDAFTGATSVLRAVVYPAIQEPPDAELMRSEPHTDLGSLTLLDSDFCRHALQVEVRGGEWQDVLLPAGLLFVNVGDELERWTRGAWRAPVHRVGIAPDGRAGQRLSLIFFHNPRSVRGVMERYLRDSALATRAGQNP